MPDQIKPTLFECSKCRRLFPAGPETSGRPPCPMCGAPPDDVKPANPQHILSCENPPDGMETEDMTIALIYRLLCTKLNAGEMVDAIDHLRRARFEGEGKVKMPGFFFAQHCVWLAKRLRG
jgi:hypothetical protein